MRMYIHVHLLHLNRAVPMQWKLALQWGADFLDNIGAPHCRFQSSLPSGIVQISPNEGLTLTIIVIRLQYQLFAIALYESRQVYALVVVGGIAGCHDSGPWYELPDGFPLGGRER